MNRPNQEHPKTRSLLIKKVMKGDYILLSKLLNVPHNTARMRFHRSNPDALRKMQLIIETRDKFIEENKL